MPATIKTKAIMSWGPVRRSRTCTDLSDMFVVDLLQLPHDPLVQKVVFSEEVGVGQLVQPRVGSGAVALSLLLIEEELVSPGVNDPLHDSLQMTLSLFGTKQNSWNVKAAKYFPK